MTDAITSAIEAVGIVPVVALVGPYPDIRFVPTGGIGPETLASTSPCLRSPPAAAPGWSNPSRSTQATSTPWTNYRRRRAPGADRPDNALKSMGVGSTPRKRSGQPTEEEASMANHHMDLTGKVAIVTGAASGIGEAVSKLYCEHGCKILGVDVDRARLAKVAEEIEAAGGVFETFLADVTEEASVRAFFKDAFARWGRIDVLVNSAGRDCSLRRSPRSRSKNGTRRSDRISPPSSSAAAKLSSTWRNRRAAAASSTWGRPRPVSRRGPATARIAPPSTECSGFPRTSSSKARTRRSASPSSTRRTSRRR